MSKVGAPVGPGLPGITFPCGLSTGLNLPLGLHLVGRPSEENLLFRPGNACQKVTDWHLKRPPVSTWRSS